MILEPWMQTWGPLSEQLAVKFMARAELDELAEYPMWLITEAIQCEQILERALAYADKTMERLAAEAEIEYCEWCVICGSVIDRSERIATMRLGIRHQTCDPW